MSIATKYCDLLGYYHHIRGRTDKAGRYYEKAFACGSEQPRTYAGYTGLLIAKGQYERAYEVITTGLQVCKLKRKQKLAIKSLTSQYIITLWKLGRLDEAVFEMEKVHQEIPSANSYQTLGYFYIEQARRSGDFSKALEFNERAKEYYDTDASILDNLGQTYFELGRERDALGMFEAALEENSNLVDSMYYASLCCQKLGDTDKAAGYAKKAKETGVKNTSTVTMEMIDALIGEIHAAKPS